MRIDYNNVRQFPAILQLLSFFLLDQDKNWKLLLLHESLAIIDKFYFGYFAKYKNKIVLHTYNLQYNFIWKGFVFISEIIGF